MGGMETEELEWIRERKQAQSSFRVTVTSPLPELLHQSKLAEVLGICRASQEWSRRKQRMNMQNSIWSRVKGMKVLFSQFLSTASKRSFCKCVMNKWSCCRVEAIEIPYVEIFILVQDEVQKSKTFKTWGENINMWIIRRKGMIQGRSQGGRELEEIFILFLSLGPISNHLEFIGLEAVSFMENINPILSSRQVQSFLIVLYCRHQGVKLILWDVKFI